MKRIRQTLTLLLYYLPALVNTLVILWVFVYPWLDGSGRVSVPWQMLLVLVLFWLSGILLTLGKWYGGIPAAAVPVYVFIENLSGYAGLSHIDWLPIAAVTVIYYSFCGVLAYRRKRHAVS